MMDLVPAAAVAVHQLWLPVILLTVILVASAAWSVDRQPS
jgi:hypothetical protein